MVVLPHFQVVHEMPHTLLHTSHILYTTYIILTLRGGGYYNILHTGWLESVDTYPLLVRPGNPKAVWQKGAAPQMGSGQSPFYLFWFSVVVTVPWPVAVSFKLESMPSHGFFLLVFRSMSLLFSLFRIPAIAFRNCPDSEPLLLWLRPSCPLWNMD